MESGLIFDIKHYSINDGPGIRTTVFFKGCPLRCAWCHNPESISSKPQKMYNASKCIGCKFCVDSCPEGACSLTSGGIVTDKKLCSACGKCAEVCPTLATEMSGRVVSVAQVVAEVEKDRSFYEESGGGVSFSGGEPTSQPDFLFALLDECGNRQLHRTVDTCGLVKTDTLLEAAKRTEHFLYDLKLMDSVEHKRWTGCSNELILENLRTLAQTDVAINIRIPLIVGVNDSEENIEQSALFLASLGKERVIVNLLPYHNIAEGKYRRLGEVYEQVAMKEPTNNKQKQVMEQFAAHGVTASIGG